MRSSVDTAVVDDRAGAAALAFDRVTCSFATNDQPPRRYIAIEDVTLAIAPEEFVAVVGPTGCGKSTLLNLAAGLLAPTSGEVRVFGAPLDARGGALNRRAGYMFQAESADALARRRWTT